MGRCRQKHTGGAEEELRAEEAPEERGAVSAGELQAEELLRKGRPQAEEAMPQAEPQAEEQCRKENPEAEEEAMPHLEGIHGQGGRIWSKRQEPGRSQPGTLQPGGDKVQTDISQDGQEMLASAPVQCTDSKNRQPGFQDASGRLSNNNFLLHGYYSIITIWHD